jgi:adenylate cyclase
VAREVAQQIKVNLGRTEAVQGPLNPVANDAYLKGRYYLNQFTESGFSQAASYFNQALAADPKFAAAYAGLSESYTFLIITNAIPPQEGWPKVRDAAQKAVELDSALSDGHLNLAHFRMHMWDWKDAEADFQRAIALNPSSEKAHRWYAAYLCSLGRHQECVKEITQSRGLDPLSSITNAEVVRELYYGRQYEEAVEEGRKAELVDPEFPRTHFWLGRVYTQLGKNSEALAEAERAGLPDSIVRVTEMAYASARAGKTVQARALVRDLQERSKRGYVPAYDLAVIHLALGENETALQWLQKAYDEHDWALVVLAVEPRLDPLRSDPRFQVLMRKVGLQEP